VIGKRIATTDSGEIIRPASRPCELARRRCRLGDRHRWVRGPNQLPRLEVAFERFLTDVPCRSWRWQMDGERG
jgi:hypothetical protein